MALDRRWKAAQNAERKHFYKYAHSRKDIKPLTEGQFFSQYFTLGSEFFNSKSILEVGCSPAAAIHSLKEARFRVGIDPLTNEWGHFLPRNNTHYIQGKGEYLPFTSETFDLVLCLNTLDHVQSPIATLKEIYRVLKRGGNLLLYLQTFSTLKIIRRGLGLIDRPHPHHFSDSSVFCMLQELGYSIDYHQYRRASFKTGVSIIKKRRIISGLKSLSANLFLGLRNSSYTCSKVM